MKSSCKNLLFLLLLPFLFNSCSKDETLYETQYDTSVEIVGAKSILSEIFLDVPYGNNGQQKYDIYLPADRSYLKTKLLILIHGGGWRSGDKEDMKKYISYLQIAHPDHAIVNMNYVLANAGVSYAFPNQFLDIQKVINSITALKYDYNIYPEFGLIGRSAGAHLALMYDYNFDANKQVKLVCSIAGPTNFDDPVFTNNPDFFQLLNLLVDPNIYPNIEENLEILSPAFQISEKSSPTTIFHGRTDGVVPISNAILLKKKLDLKSVNSHLRIFGGGHTNWTEKDDRTFEKELSSYIRIHLPIQ